MPLRDWASLRANSKIKLLRVSYSTALNLKQGAPWQLYQSRVHEAGPESESFGVLGGEVQFYFSLVSTASSHIASAPF